MLFSRRILQDCLFVFYFALSSFEYRDATTYCSYFKEILEFAHSEITLWTPKKLDSHGDVLIPSFWMDTNVTSINGWIHCLMDDGSLVAISRKYLQI